MSSSYLSSYFYHSRKVPSCKLSPDLNLISTKKREKILNTFEFHLIICSTPIYKFIFSLSLVFLRTPFILGLEIT